MSEKTWQQMTPDELLTEITKSAQYKERADNFEKHYRNAQKEIDALQQSMARYFNVIVVSGVVSYVYDDTAIDVDQNGNSYRVIALAGMSDIQRADIVFIVGRLAERTWSGESAYIHVDVLHIEVVSRAASTDKAGDE